MADIRCPNCGEPWDNDELHFAVEEGDYLDYDTAYQTFRSKGCGVVFGNSSCRPDENATIRQELAHMMGDDSDGYMSIMEDFADLL